MITKKTRHGITAMVLLTAISFWFSRSQDDEVPAPVAGLDPKLDYVLREFEIQSFDENGKPSINIRAPVFRNNPELQLGTIESPVIKLNQPDATWSLTSDLATVTADKEHVRLSGRVHVQKNEITTGNWVELKTEEVQIEVTPQTASTDLPVSVFDGLNRLTAVGMELDMKSSTYKLKQQVKASYAVK
jgi:LPS export ABC transporter protein LptC